MLQTQTVELITEQDTTQKEALLANITNQQIAEVLFNIATLLEMQQGNPYRIAAYRNAARILMILPLPAAEMLRRTGKLEIPGVGRRLRRKITELVTTGHMTFYKDLCEEVLSADIRSLMAVPRVGPQTALRLSSQLGIHSVAELYEAAHAHKLREHYGFGPRSEQRLEEGARSALNAKAPEQAEAYFAPSGWGVTRKARSTPKRQNRQKPRQPGRTTRRPPEPLPAGISHSQSHCCLQRQPPCWRAVRQHGGWRCKQT
jgi:DNA polymerase (family 10)